MSQVTITIDVGEIFIIAAVLTVIASLWMIVYFGSRIALNVFVRSQIGDMPTTKEISTLYKELNDKIRQVQDDTAESITQGIDNG